MDKLFLKEDDLQRAIQQHMKKRLSKINSTNKHDLPKLGIHGRPWTEPVDLIGYYRIFRLSVKSAKNFEPTEIIPVIMHNLWNIRWKG